jgi:oligoribonuclease NrnB/cAMP/cGMP phosphodiesterase (DHH superfamily)
MIPVEKLKAVKSVIVHENCADGLVSALLIRDALFRYKEPTELPIRFMQYETDEHKALNPEPGMLFADFSPHQSRVAEFVAAGAIVLDHHKKAQPIVEAFGENGVFADEAKDPGISGAVLAHREVWLPTRAGCYSPQQEEFISDFATLCGIRDTWQRGHARWREAIRQHEILMFMPRERWLALDLGGVNSIAATWKDMEWIGDVRLQKQEMTVQKIIERSWKFTTAKGTRVVTFEGVKQSSDVADAIDKGADLVVAFNYEIQNGTPKMIFSTRSHTHYDCGEMCKSFGGGGHTKAAGFSRVLDIHQSLNPYGFVEALVRKYEGEAFA